MFINIPDTSFWEGKIDFEVMKSRADYVILKASQYVIDHEFLRGQAECERVGLPYGAYHYYDNRTNPLRQAMLFSGLFTGKASPVEIWCDWEDNTIGDYSGIKNVVAFMQEVERRMSMEMGFYTGYYFFLDHTNIISNYFQLKFLQSRKLWLAGYLDHTSSHPELVKVPRPWMKMDLWQYTDRGPGRYYGCDSEEVDLNVRMTDPIPTRLGNSLIFPSGLVYKEQL